MAVMPYSTASACWSSVFTLPIFTRPSYSSANSSNIGISARQGLHHWAQKSTRTGVADCSTSVEKFSCVKVTILRAGIGNKVGDNFRIKSGDHRRAVLTLIGTALLQIHNV